MNHELNEAIAEMQSLITSKFPHATYAVSEGDDPEGTYLRATVDVEDTDEVVEAYIDRLVELQLSKELLLYVVPVRPVSRVAELAKQSATTGHQLSFQQMREIAREDALSRKATQ